MPDSSTVGAFGRLVAAHRFGFVIDLAAALPAKVAIFFLGGRNKPKTATGLAQNGRAQQPFVESDLVFYPHCFPLVRRVFRALSDLNNKRRDSFNKVCQLHGDKENGSSKSLYDLYFPIWLG